MKLLLLLGVMLLAGCAPTASQYVPTPSEGYTLDSQASLTKAEPYKDTAYNLLMFKVNGTSEVSSVRLYLVGPAVRTGVNSNCTTLSTTLQRCKVSASKASYVYSLPYKGLLEKAFAEYTRSPGTSESQDLYAIMGQ